MKSNIVIKTIEKNEYKDIPRVYSDSFDDQAWAEDWYAIPEFDEKATWLAKDEDQVVGFIISFLSGNTPYLSVLAVKKAYQKQGIARSLVETCIGYWQRHDYDFIRIHVDHDKKTARRLYDRMGFKEEKIRSEDTELLLNLRKRD